MGKDYFDQLALAARWRMPPGEAEDFLSDYREILEDNPRSEAELIRELGTPWAAVRLAADRRAYCRWLGIFAAMAACLLLPALCGLSGRMGWLPYLRPLTPEILLPAAGTAAALVFFRRRGQAPRQRPPRPLWALLALLPALFALVTWWVWRVLPDLVAAPRAGLAAQGSYLLLSLLAAGLGLWGLAAARVRNRRWRALYVMALATAALCCAALLYLRRMDYSETGLAAAWSAYLGRCAVIAGIGLAGTGAALC